MFKKMFEKGLCPLNYRITINGQKQSNFQRVQQFIKIH
jgi:hypothetical protein